MVLGLFGKIILLLFSALVFLTYRFYRELSLYAAEVMSAYHQRLIEKNQERAKVAVLRSRLLELEKSMEELKQKQSQADNPRRVHPSLYENDRKLRELKAETLQPLHKNSFKVGWVERSQTAVPEKDERIQRLLKRVHREESGSQEQENRKEREKLIALSERLKAVTQSFQKNLQRLEDQSFQDQRKMRKLEKQNKSFKKQIRSLEKKKEASSNRPVQESLLDIIQAPKSLDEIEIIKAKIDQARKDLFVMQSHLEKEVA